jgi:hypothetical protein
MDGLCWHVNNGCDILIRDSALSSIASDLVKTGHWEAHDPGTPPPWEVCPPTEHDADFVLRRMDITHDSEYHYLSLWTETTYHISVDDCPTVEVPDVYPWHHMLVEENWYPAINRDDGSWYGPRLHPHSKLPNLPERAKPSTLFSKGLPRGKSATNDQPVLIPSLPTYLDALIYHITRYHQYSKPRLYASASAQLSNLTRYLYLELPHQQLSLLIEMEEYEFMEKHLANYKRKPVFAHHTTSQEAYKATRVKE